MKNIKNEIRLCFLFENYRKVVDSKALYVALNALDIFLLWLKGGCQEDAY